MRSLILRLNATVVALFLVSVCIAGGSNGEAGPVDSLALFAGDCEGFGNRDGIGTTARFNNLRGVATDSAGNVYVADTENYTIRKITPTGSVTTLAGTAGVRGSADGIGAAARFFCPFSVASDSAGNLYVVDAIYNTIRKITPAGGVTTLAGKAGKSGSADGIGAVARFNNPCSVATDSTGNVYVADSGNYTIRKITPAGGVTTLAGAAEVKGNADGIGAAARFNNPCGVATDSAGNVYVADSGNHTIRKITSAGGVTTLSGTVEVKGSTDGVGAEVCFDDPCGVATDSAGNVYVADSGNQSIRKITPTGGVTTLAGAAEVKGNADGIGAAARFNRPRGVATDSAGNVYVADSGNHTIRKIMPSGGVTTLAGKAGKRGSTDGNGPAARFNNPSDVATDSAGNVYVSDSLNRTIRKITSSGWVTTLAGMAGAYGSRDGIGAVARFSCPSGVATDSAGNVYVSDTENHTVRKITPAGRVTTLAGMAGKHGSSDGIGAAARFHNPFGVATDNAGNVYVSDCFNHTIRKITPVGRVITTVGRVTTIAGMAGGHGSSDGIGAAALFDVPQLLATDSAGNVYVVDCFNHTIRKITPAGRVTTVVGVAGKIAFAPGVLPGALAFPRGVAISGSLLYITLRNGVAVASMEKM